MSIVTICTASCRGASWETGPSSPVVATKAVMPSTSGTPAATAAPNTSSRMISVPIIEICCDLASSARSVAPSALRSDAPPCSWTSTSGWAFWTAATAARGASAALSSASFSSFVSALPGSVKFTSTERPSFETVLAWCFASRGLSMSETPLIWPRRLTTSLTAAVTSGSSALIEPLPWISTRSPISSW